MTAGEMLPGLRPMKDICPSMGVEVLDLSLFEGEALPPRSSPSSVKGVAVP
jgi:hypothetical protein